MFAQRTHRAVKELKPGDSRFYRLPPATPGPIIIDARSGFAVSGVPIAHASGRTISGIHVGGHAAGGVNPNIVTPHVAPGNHTGATGDLATDLDPDVPGFGPTTDLNLELLLGGQVRASSMNHIFLESPHGADAWTLKVTRKADGSIETRSYQLDVTYQSTLPQEERRIPMDFFRRGFKANWNDHPYLAFFGISGNVISYKLDSQFAKMYQLEEEPEGISLGGGGLVKLPTIHSGKIEFFADGGPSPFPAAPNDPPQAHLPYFCARISAVFENSRDVEITGLPDITLPADLHFDIRFYLHAATSGTVGYTVDVSSPLLDMLNFDVPGIPGGISRPFNVKKVIKDGLENTLTQLQHGDGGNRFDRHIRPWLVGNFEVLGLVYDPASDAIVIDYVGRKQAATNQNVVFPDPTETEVPESLFVTPDETPPPGNGTGFDPGTHVYTSTAGALSKIEHFVVLMQENRSFDQVLGYLSRDLGHENVEGLLPGDNERDKVKFENDIYRSTLAGGTGWPSFAVPGPSHHNQAVIAQMGNDMKGGVGEFAKHLAARNCKTVENVQRIMDYYGVDPVTAKPQLPAYAGLVREFAICDHWFCSHIGPTLPNRYVSLTGDLNHDPFGNTETDNPELTTYTPTEAETIFDHLTKRGIDWKVFEHGYCTMRLFRNFTFDVEKIRSFTDLDNGFVATALRGDLPALTFIEPNYIEAPPGNDDHAPADMMAGQLLIATIVKALIESPQWEKTMLIITYDEHGGFYDHVTPPESIRTKQADGTPLDTPIPPLANLNRRLGPRVPAFIVSPWIKRGADGVNVSHTVYDHTSIAATVFRGLCSPRPPKLSPRAQHANDLRGLLERETARPASEFAELLGELQAVIAAGTVAAPSGSPRARLYQKPMPPETLTGTAEDRSYLEDFHGFIAFATTMTGIGPG